MSTWVGSYSWLVSIWVGTYVRTYSWLVSIWVGTYVRTYSWLVSTLHSVPTYVHTYVAHIHYLDQYWYNVPLIRSTDLVYPSVLWTYVCTVCTYVCTYVSTSSTTITYTHTVAQCTYVLCIKYCLCTYLTWVITIVQHFHAVRQHHHVGEDYTALKLEGTGAVYVHVCTYMYVCTYVCTYVCVMLVSWTPTITSQAIISQTQGPSTESCLQTHNSHIHRHTYSM